MFTFPQLNEERAISNNPLAWDVISNQLERVMHLINGTLLPGVHIIEDAGTEVTAVLFCMVLTAERENIEGAFKGRIDQYPGRSFGARMLKWAEDRIEARIDDRVKIIWEGIRTKMAHALEILMRDLKPQGPTTPEQVVEWITRRGGVGKLSQDYIALRRKQAVAEAEARKSDREIANEVRKQRAAEAAPGWGTEFDTVEGYEQHLAKKAQEAREAALRARFDDLKARLVANGTVTTTPPDGKLLIAHGRKLYVLSDADELALLQCAASVM